MPKRGKKKAVIVKKKLAENHSDDGIASYESDSEYRYEEADEDSSYECYSQISSVLGKKIKKHTKKKQGQKKGLSLRKLTPEFRKLVMRQDNHILNINTAQTALFVQKRRIYDMTNSLQALNYLQKCGKSKVRWIETNEEHERQYVQLCEKIQEVKQKIKELEEDGAVKDKEVIKKEQQLEGSEFYL